MSKGGGAGKVYFVLYLAVVLELLIIIVERDEAEEGLLKKQKETMKIVESILSQLQSGAGTEGINTRPQDEITIPPAGMETNEYLGNIKAWRKYIIEVGVTDISADLKKKEGESSLEHTDRLKKLIKLGNVEKIEYQIFYNQDKDSETAPMFITDNEIRKRKIDFTEWTPGQTIASPDEEASSWEFLGVRKLVLDNDETFNNIDDYDQITLDMIKPIYPADKKILIGDSYRPKDLENDEEEEFFYSEAESLNDPNVSSGTQDLVKRAFVVNFAPPDQAGWYKLRFTTHTNQILGVRADLKVPEASDDTPVNIGTVQLTVKDLRKVNKELSQKLEKYKLPSMDILTIDKDVDAFDEELKEATATIPSDDPDAADVRGKIRLYGYIAKLLAPGMSSYFPQNRGNIEFDIRVITPKMPLSTPEIAMPKYVTCFDAVAPAFEYVISPYQGPGANMIDGKVLDQMGATVARVESMPLDEMADLSVMLPPQGGGREFRGILDKKLSPGKYSIIITHQLIGKQKLDTALLEIFDTGLTEESRKRTESILSFSYYGFSPRIDCMPTSGGKIESDQFRMYFRTDAEEQKPAIQGLSTGKENALVLDPMANNILLKITWIQPYTKKEVILFPEKSFPIRQEEPQIIVKPRIDPSGTASKIKVRISGVKLAVPLAGPDGENAEVSLEIDGYEKTDGLKNYNVSLEPILSGDNDSGYEIYFEIKGKMEPRQKKVSGTIAVKLKAFSRNPFNNKVSDVIRKTVNAYIDYAPSKTRRRR